MEPHYVIKATLGNTEEQFYKNVKGEQTTLLLTNIRVCNITATAAKIYVSVSLLDGDFESGAIVFGANIAANSTLDIPERALILDNIVRAYSDTAAALVFSADVKGDYGQYEPSI